MSDAMSDAVYRFRFMRPSFLGWICRQCHWIYPHPVGAIQHEERIKENGGICPDRGTPAVRPLSQEGVEGPGGGSCG